MSIVAAIVRDKKYLKTIQRASLVSAKIINLIERESEREIEQNLVQFYEKRARNCE